MSKNQMKTVSEPTKAEEKIKKFASISHPKLELDVAHSCQPITCSSSVILDHEHQQQVTSTYEAARDKVKAVLDEFKEEFTKLMKEWKSKPEGERRGTYRADLKAARILKKKGKWINCVRPCVGEVPGVDVGTRFQYRTELAIIGLHPEYMRGIHCEKIEGITCAISIVDSGRYYNNKRINADNFIYIGEGGNLAISHSHLIKNQKLNGGNLGLKNSMDLKIPVRLIRGYNHPTSRSGILFEYCGLYQVTGYVYDRDLGSGNKLVFQFKMKKMSNFQINHHYQQQQEEVEMEEVKMEKMVSPAVKNVNKSKASKFLYSSSPFKSYGGYCRPSSSICSGIWNADEGFNYEAAAAMAKPISSNRRAYARSHTNSKLKLG